MRKDHALNTRTYGLSIVCILLAGALLIDSPALFAPYLIAAVFALYCLMQNRFASFDTRSRSYRIITAVSVISAAFITIANYSIWLYPSLPDARSAMFVRLYKALLMLVIFAGSFVCAHNIFRFVCFDRNAFAIRLSSEPEKCIKFFLIPFCIISAIYITFWLCCYYPGLLSLDSIDQIRQIFTGEYSNHQPFYHTQLLGLFIRIGLSLTQNMNAAVAAYVIVQILFMAAVFAFTVYNLAKLRLPVWTAVAATVWYAVMPFHIMFSYTVWKDVYFGAFVTLLILYFIRLVKNIGKSGINLAGFGISGLVICLIRSNGLFAYVFVLLAVLILLRSRRDLLFIMIATVAAAFILKHTVLGWLGVTPPDTVESLSMPLQQVARVVADDGNISAEDEQLLSNIIDVSSIKDIYDPVISDPVKNAIRDFGNQDYLSSHKGDFALMYIRTFFKNPMKYVIAWVDGTCGYWNSGYNYWVWFWDIEDNPYGITRQVASSRLLLVMDEYLWLFYNNPILQIFTAIGLFVWICILAFARCISDRNTVGIISIVPILAILLSLLVSSPVYAEFRYMYALFCALPILLAVTCHNREV